MRTVAWVFELEGKHCVHLFVGCYSDRGPREKASRMAYHSAHKTINIPRPSLLHITSPCFPSTLAVSTPIIKTLVPPNPTITIPRHFNFPFHPPSPSTSPRSSLLSNSFYLPSLNALLYTYTNHIYIKLPTLDSRV